MAEFIDFGKVFIRADKINCMSISEENKKMLRFDIEGCKQLYDIIYDTEESCKNIYAKTAAFLLGKKATGEQTSEDKKPEWEDEPLECLLAELDRLDIEGKRNANSCKVGYAQKLYRASLDSIKDGGFKTVGQLLDRGSRWYSKCYGVGKKHVEKVDEALTTSTELNHGNMKTISQIAQENSMEYAEGMKEAFRMIEREIDHCAINGYKFPILHIRDFIDKMLERKK